VLEAADRLTVKLPCPVARVVPSWKLASPTLSVGTTGGGGVDGLSSTRLLAAVLPLLVEAWKPKLVWPPAATLAFQSALRIT
jgi:hypothetical protein